MTLPARMRAAVLDGTGREHLAVRTVPVPEPGPGQLLCRVDAAGICTSVNKLLDQGAEHPLMSGWDPARFPVIVGDEGAVTVMAVGEDLRGVYEPGDRFAVQPAVDHAPITHRERYHGGGRHVAKVAVGYSLPGLLAEHVLIGEEVLAAGCLLPLPDPDLPAAHAALAEPISCVISSHAHHVHLRQSDATSPRVAANGLAANGVVVIIGAGPMGRMHVDVAVGGFARAVIVTARRQERLDRIEEQFSARAAARNIDLVTVNAIDEDLAGMVEALSDGLGADDVIVTAADGAVIEAAQHLLARNGVLNLFAGLPAGSPPIGIDERFVHYQEITITGSSGGGPWDVQEALRMMADGSIDASGHIAHVGDLDHAPELLDMAREGRLEGKAIVYPHRRGDTILNVPRWGAGDEQRYLADGP